MFGLLKDVANLAGTVAGSVVGLSAAVISETLSIPIEFVKAARDAGCETTEEIRKWIRDNR